MAERELNRSERAPMRKLVTELCANYDSQDKICLPLDSSCYMLNKWWTGAYCRYFEKAVLPVDAALESSITEKHIFLRPARHIVLMPAGSMQDGNPSGNANAGNGKINHDMSAT